MNRLTISALLIITTAALAAIAHAEQPPMRYIQTDNRMAFVIDNTDALFAPTEAAQDELKKQGHRPADSFGGEYTDCSRPGLRCFDATSGGIMFALDIAAFDRSAPYNYMGWRFEPRCLSMRATGKCGSGIVRFSPPEKGQLHGFFVFSDDVGIVSFGLIDELQGGLAGFYSLDASEWNVGLLGPAH